MPRKPLCECGECPTCLHRVCVARKRMRQRIGWLSKEQRMERWMSGFDYVYWSDVFRRGVPSLRLNTFRN